MDKDKQTFVTTKVNGVFALKLSNDLPVQRYPGLDTLLFKIVQCGFDLTIYKENESKNIFTIDARHENEDISGIYKAKEYDVILIGKDRLSIVDEQVYLESYSLGNKALSRQDYNKLKDLAKKKLKTEEDIMSYYMSLIKTGTINKDFAEALLKDELGNKYTSEHLRTFCTYFDCYDLHDIIRNRAYLGIDRYNEDLMHSGIAEISNYKNRPGTTKISDKYLIKLGLNPEDFDEEGWYKWSERFLRTQAFNLISEKFY